MGYQYEPGTKTRTPQFLSNRYGRLSWSGKDVAELNEYDGWSMRRFIMQEAYRFGYEDGAMLPAWNPFDPEMLFGEPYRLWAYCYRCGQYDKAEGLPVAHPETESLPAHEYGIWAGIIQNLEEMANSFEQSYKKIGVKQRSSLRGLMLSICGWFNESDAEFVPVFDEKGWRYI